MPETVSTPLAEPLTADEPEAPGSQAGALLFPEVVLAHYRWLSSALNGGADDETARTYRRKVEQFQDGEGEILGAYWCVSRPSAVALTIRRSRLLWKLMGVGDDTIRLHRASDWSTAEEARIAELLHYCDTLAVKVGEVLRGTPQRIAMEWIFAQESYLLGFLERRKAGGADNVGEVIKQGKRELLEIEKYYERAGNKAARIVYFWGMMSGVLFVAAAGAILAALLHWVFGAIDPDAASTRNFFASYAAGAIGSIVSVLTRMKSESGFTLDYEVGRGASFRLGSFRPFLGAIFGVAIYFALQSDLVQFEPPDGKDSFYFFTLLAFLAGFSERWTRVMLGSAERTIEATLDGGEKPGEPPPPSSPPDGPQRARPNGRKS